MDNNNDARTKLAGSDPETTNLGRKLGIFTNWANFEVAAASCSAIPEKIWADAVVEEVSTYMDKMGLMESIHYQLLSYLRSGAPVIRVSHQPNLFAGLNVLGLTMYACEIAKMTGSIPVLVGVDYDEAGDQRFRTSLLPPTNGSAPVYLKGAVPRGLRRMVAYGVPKPDAEIVRDWIKLQEQTALHWRRHFKLFANQRYLISDLPYLEFLNRADSLTEFNLSLMVFYAKEVFGCDILAVPASRLLPNLNGPINELINTLVEADPTCANRLIWRICGTCYERCPTVPQNGSRLFAGWRCTFCHVADLETLDWTKMLELEVGSTPAFVPRVALCDAIDFRMARSRGSISYAGGVKHIFDSRLLALKAGLDIIPEFVWEPTNLFQFVPGEEKINEGWKKGKYSAFVLNDIFGSERLIHEIGQNVTPRRIRTQTKR
ncbi:MAG TPA: hypothetical protein VLA88_06390 [Candidatus Saccharimonadales bacterium]|nr:hypothetical protein [Candidatus Saccharimonadales bacterium]